LSIKAPFGFPHGIGTLEAFCHPSAANALAHPLPLADGEMGAANGYLAIRIERGRWMPEDFPLLAEDAALARFLALPWGAAPDAQSAEWRALDDVRGDIYRNAPISPWTDKHKPTPCPVWKVGGGFLARLSHLQLLARLPRIEIYAGEMSAARPLYFRFTAGRGMIAQDRRLTTHSRELFKPAYHPLHGHRIARHAPAKPGNFLNQPAPVPEQPIDDWPPAPSID
jgi:hypothetical protein